MPRKFELPAEASNQEHVYIRFMPDYNSENIGVSDSRDGNMLADVFVLADWHSQRQPEGHTS